MPTQSEINLIAEQLRQAEVNSLRAELRHLREMTDARLKLLEHASLDHETRLRAATDGVTSFKTWSGLANGGSSILALLALVKSFFLP
ncbi:MAG: hypothetical protein HPY76_00940 [Anaerolineae bacterium]|nr:hypothetical protein [Anaerolineae bacterium]